ncbi:MAG: hypothetical protein GXY48_15485 [Methanomicrobiales archaeon]|nr:hypothetical protein [Methanomicrobiales archaeon]
MIISIGIFLITLFFLILITRPALFLNDEWITVNQVHQFTQGHQVLYNEGKYGFFANGTPTMYFSMRSNVLGYSMALPLLSLPAFALFSIFSDHFRFCVILLCSFIPLLLALMIETCKPGKNRLFGVKILWVGFVCSFLILITNLLLYYPFSFTRPDAPFETAGIVLTNALLCSIIAVVSFCIGKTLFTSNKFAILSAFAVMLCSSYFFWAGTAKDHILLTAVFSLVLLFLIRFITSSHTRDLFLSFFLIGILAWVRAEVGLAIFLSLILYCLLDGLHHRRKGMDLPCSLKHLIAAPLCTIIGAIPFFINNYLLTGNPIIPPFYYYLIHPELGIIKRAGEQVLSNATVVESISIADGPADFLQLIQAYFSVPISDIIMGGVSVLFAPVSGNISVMTVTPIFALAIIAIPIILFWSADDLPSIEKRTIGALFILLIGFTLAYAKSLPSISASPGMLPDMRYFLPIYLIGGILGLIALNVLYRRGSKYPSLTPTFIIPVIGTVVLLLGLIIFHPFGGVYLGYTRFFFLSNSILTLLLIICYYLSYTGKIRIQWTFTLLGVVLTFPASWQILMTFFYSVTKFNGYPFWLPFVEQMFLKFIGVSGMG